MSKGFAKTVVVGNLGKDPEIRYTQSGSAVANFSVAATTGYGEYEHTEWYRCVVWKKLAQVCSEHLSKGSRVLVEGELRTRKWEDQSGQTRYSTELHTRNVVFLGGGRNGEAAGPASDVVTDDDIPF